MPSDSGDDFYEKESKKGFYFFEKPGGPFPLCIRAMKELCESLKHPEKIKKSKIGESPNPVKYSNILRGET